MKFNGTLPELQTILEKMGVQCHWQHKGSFEVAVIDDGVSNLKLNWWPESGVLQLVGDPEQRIPMLENLSQALDSDAASP